MIWLPVSVAMVGKFLISMTFAIAYLYTAELFPTKVRNVAVGTASTFARIGSMSAPYIVDLLVWLLKTLTWARWKCFFFQGAIHPAIPVIIFGAFSASAGMLSLMLPETLNRKMPESVAEVEEWAKRGGSKWVLTFHFHVWCFNMVTFPFRGEALGMNALQGNPEA